MQPVSSGGATGRSAAFMPLQLAKWLRALDILMRLARSDREAA
jgi:hypothetical protein